MARAEPPTSEKPSLYDRDFNLWVEQQAALLREGHLGDLDAVDLLEEIEDLGINRKHAVTSNLVVVIMHLLKYRYQPRRRSRSWLSSIYEHRRRLRKELAASPSLRPYARSQLEECYQDGRRLTLIETGLGDDVMPSEPIFSLEQTLDPDFLPD